MQAILALQPNITLLDSENNSILHYAAMSKAEILEVVLQLPDVYQLFFRNKKQWTPVELACINTKKDNLQRMMTRGLTAQMLTLVTEPGSVSITFKSN